MLVIGNGRMITQDASNPFLENGAVAMDGNTIVMVGVTEEVKKVYPDAEFVDAIESFLLHPTINNDKKDNVNNNLLDFMLIFPFC